MEDEEARAHDFSDGDAVEHQSRSRHCGIVGGKGGGNNADACLMGYSALGAPTHAQPARANQTSGIVLPCHFC